MTASTPASPVRLDFFCSDEDLFLALGRIFSGDPLPENVLRDIDPYQHRPWNLPDDIWYFVQCNGNTNSLNDHWKPKSEDCKLYSNSSFSGWRTTFEFYEGEAPHEHKTAWILQKYWITPEELCENGKKNEASSLCKVFLGDEHFANYEKIQKVDTSIISNANPINPNQLVAPDASNTMANGSSSMSHISEDDKMVEVVVAGKPLDNHSEGISDMDYLSRGDFLELLDLDIPASPSSSSENSSCLTMSSDEFFDSVALLQDLDRDMVQRGAACKFSSSTSSRINKVVLDQGASESLVSRRGNHSQARVNLRIDGGPAPGSSAPRNEEQDIKLSSQNLKLGNRFEGPSPSSQTKMVVSTDQETAMNQKKKVTVGRMKKIQKMYLCFFPF